MKKFIKLFSLLALAPTLLFLNAEAANVHITDLTVEDGIYFPGDPVPMSVTVTNFGDNPADDDGYQVDIHLTPDGEFRSVTDHFLQFFTGVLWPGQSHTYEWVQYLPGNLTGEFIVDAEVYGDVGSGIRMWGTGAGTARIEIQSEQSGTFPTTSLLTRNFNSPDLQDEEVSYAGLDDDDEGVPGFNTNGNSETPSISADGRYVVYASRATNLVPGVEIFPDGEEEDSVTVFPSGNVFDVYIQDTKEGDVVLASKPGGVGEFSNGNSLNPSISPDGRYVAFHSTANNLVSGGDNGFSDVYVYDRLSATLQRVSRGYDGSLPDAPSFNAVVSNPDHNGHRYVAFESEAENLVQGDDNGFSDIFLYNLNTGTTRRVNVTDDAAQAVGGHSRNPVISADGRHVAFESRATNLGSSEQRWDVFVHDRDANHSGSFDESGSTRTVQLSVGFDADGNAFPADGDSYSPSITDDGRFIAFVSEAANLYNHPATGSVTLSGRATEADIVFEDNVPGSGTITFAEDVNATGTVEFLGNPTPTQSERRTITFSDGEENVTFEFANPEFYTTDPDNLAVIVGSSPASTRNNLRNAILDSGLALSVTADVSDDGNPMLRLENIERGEAGNDEPIETANLDTVVEVTGIGTDPENQAQITNVQDGDEILIDNGLFETVLRFVDGEPQEDNEIEIANTAAGTRNNLMAVLEGLLELDIPDITPPTDAGTFLVGPLASNPEHQDTFTFVHEGDEIVFQFVERDIQFDPSVILTGQAIEVTIGNSLEVTRGNLVRTLQAFFDFEDLPPLGDTPARGSIRIRVNPAADDDATVTIDDGGTVVVFSFVEEFEEDEDDPDFDFEEAIIDDREPEDVLIRIGGTAGQTQDRLMTAINRSPLAMTARPAFDEDDNLVIELIHHEIGEVGNIPIEATPEPEPPDDPDEEADEPIIVTVGMDGGGVQNAEGGDLHTYYEHELLHPSVTFEFTVGTQVGQGNIRAGLAGSGDATLGNLLDAIDSIGIPRIRPSVDEEAPHSVFLTSLLPSGLNNIVFEAESTAENDALELVFEGGTVNTPRDGATITINDGDNTVTFEFDQNGMVDNDHIAVPVGRSAAAIRDLLISLIQGSDLEVSAEDATREHPTVRVVNNRRGALPGDPFVTGEDLPGSVSISIIEGHDNPVAGESFTLSDGELEVTFEFVDAAGDEDEGHVAVVLGENQARDETFENLVAAVRGTDLKITAVPADGDGAPGINLTNRVPGPEGNVFITTVPEDFPSFEVDGMSGGGLRGDGTPQVYVHDRDTNQNDVYDQIGNLMIEPVSLTETGEFGQHPSLEPDISNDGRYVSFRTFGFGMQPLTVERSDGQVFPNVFGPTLVFPVGDEIPVDDEDVGSVTSLLFVLKDRINNFTENGRFSDIYVRDRETGINERVSVNRFGETPGVGGSVTIGFPTSNRNAVMSADGRYVVFASDNQRYNNNSFASPRAGDETYHGGALAVGMTNRHSINSNRLRDVFIHDRKFSSGVSDPEPTFPPTVSLNEPVDGQVLGLGRTVTLGATALANSAHPGAEIQGVDFLVNGEIVGSDNSRPFSVEWQPDLPGEYVIAARAHDTRGESATATPVTVTVTTSDPGVRDEDFVRDVYERLLGRSPDAFELNRDQNRLEDGDVSRPGLIAQLMDRMEFERLRVDGYAAYPAILGRIPETNTEMETAIDMILTFADDVDLPDPDGDGEVVVPDEALFAGLQTLILSLLETNEFRSKPNWSGGYLFNQDVDFAKLLWRNIGRSMSELRQVQAVTVIADFNRLIYATGFVMSATYTDPGPNTGPFEFGMPDGVRERFRRGAAFYALTDNVPTPQEFNDLQSGSRSDAAARILGSADYQNQHGSYFAPIERTGTNRKHSDWLGAFGDGHFDYGTNTGWINHEEHGWWYRTGTSRSWVYDDIMGGWVWTNSGIYPFFYSHNENTWLFYEKGGSPESRMFYFYDEGADTGTWQEVD